MQSVNLTYLYDYMLKLNNNNKKIQFLFEQIYSKNNKTMLMLLTKSVMAQMLVPLQAIVCPTPSWP